MPPVFSEGPPRGGPSSFSPGSSLDSAHMARVSLRLLGEDDLAFLSEAVSDESIRRLTRIREPPPAGFPQTWLGAYEAARADGTREAFVVVEDGTAVGLALAPSIDREAATAELGYLVTAGARGRGLATIALRLLSEWAFEELGMIRLELHIGTENVASQAVARRAGYTLEGTLRSAHLKQGRREDTQIWSRLRTDVP
jgi:RimJ/RimL family protein N-acetyltransferase